MAISHKSYKGYLYENMTKFIELKEMDRNGKMGVFPRRKTPPNGTTCEQINL